MITYVDPTVTFEQLCTEMKDICRFNGDQVFTMKWVDEEGKPGSLKENSAQIYGYYFELSTKVLAALKVYGLSYYCILQYLLDIGQFKP